MSQKSCDTCQHHERGVIHGYTWQTCAKDWRERPNGPVIGVIKHLCGSHKPKKETP